MKQTFIQSVQINNFDSINENRNLTNTVSEWHSVSWNWCNGKLSQQFYAPHISSIHSNVCTHNDNSWIPYCNADGGLIKCKWRQWRMVIQTAEFTRNTSVNWMLASLWKLILKISESVSDIFNFGFWGLATPYVKAVKSFLHTLHESSGWRWWVWHTQVLFNGFKMWHN
jgi:hypothetical protein